ncbi:PilN domain-containing protein [Aliidiomarina quisquiliarum]|uniref:PilN domain-containing protein n=1 Tax=Aliidiomarina quisquiliarum TaxID=2938947 RepID=UPI00208F12AE|nr:PilN domain-containing protein [Aliidiomarina quisquiliarum]MCO4322479.1 PilN domain-containing protein [Aliidiomarina quisquiliarum]
MKRDINLYHDSLRPSKELLTTGRLLISLLIVVVVSAFARGGYEYATTTLTKTHNEARNEQTALSTHMVELASQLSRQQPDRLLLRRTERIELDADSRRALLDEFNRRGKIRRDNLSPVLQELASIHMAGLWLTRISIQAGGVELEGHTLAPGLIPRWMAKFDAASTLTTHKFSVVELRRDSRDILSFALLSKPKAPIATESAANSGNLLNQFNEQLQGEVPDEKPIP